MEHLNPFWVFSSLVLSTLTRCNSHHHPSPGGFIIPTTNSVPRNHWLPIPLQPVVISVLHPALWICQQHVLANTLGDWRGGRCIQIWELSDQIISRVPLGGGGFSCSVISDYLWPYGPLPARLLCLWDFSGKNTGVGSHSRLQGIFLTQGLNSCLLHCRFFTDWASRETRLFLKFYLTGKGPYCVHCTRVWPHVHPQAVSHTWLWWWLFLFTFTEQSWSALSFCGTASSSPAPVPGPEWLPLPLSVVSLQFSFIIHAAWQFLPCSRCLVWSLWFPPTTLTLVIPLIFKQNHNISQLPVHPFITPVFVVWGSLPVDSEREDEHSCILDPWRMPAKAAWRR